MNKICKVERLTAVVTYENIYELSDAEKAEFDTLDDWGKEEFLLSLPDDRVTETDEDVDLRETVGIEFEELGLDNRPILR